MLIINRLIYRTSLKYIGARAFFFALNMQRVNLPEDLNTIGEEAFNYCTNLTSIVVPDGVKTIQKKAFFGCSKLKTMTLGKGVESLGESAMAGCSSLEELEVKSEVPPTLGQDALKNIPTSSCALIVPVKSLAAYKKGDGWKDFLNIEANGPADEFWYNGLRYKVISHDEKTCRLFPKDSGEYYEGDIVVPSEAMNCGVLYTVTAIATYAFDSCPITSLEIPASVTSIGVNPILNCKNLTTLTVAEGGNFYVKNNCLISNNGVLVATLLKKDIVVPEGVKKIATQAMDDVVYETIQLPSTLTSLEYWAIADCPNLTTLTCLATTPPEVEDSFGDIDVPVETCILKVPFGTKAAYAAAFGWNEFTNIQELGQATTIVSVLDITVDLSGLKFKVGDTVGEAYDDCRNQTYTSETEGVGHIYKRGLAYWDKSSRQWSGLSYGSTDLVNADTDYATYIEVELNDGYKYDTAANMTVTVNGKTHDARNLTRFNASRYMVFIPVSPKDDATGINTAASPSLDSNLMYNLQGQSVGSGYKGIVVRNGKKVYVK